MGRSNGNTRKTRQTQQVRKPREAVLRYSTSSVEANIRKTGAQGMRQVHEASKGDQR